MLTKGYLIELPEVDLLVDDGDETQIARFVRVLAESTNGLTKIEITTRIWPDESMTTPQNSQWFFSLRDKVLKSTGISVDVTRGLYSIAAHIRYERYATGWKFEIDPAEVIAYAEGRVTERFLYHLVKAGAQGLTREELIQAVWERDDDGMRDTFHNAKYGVTRLLGKNKIYNERSLTYKFPGNVYYHEIEIELDSNNRIVTVY